MQFLHYDGWLFTNKLYLPSFFLESILAIQFIQQ